MKLPQFYLLMTLGVIGFLVFGSLAPFRFSMISFKEARDLGLLLAQSPWELQSHRIDFVLNTLITVPLGFFGMGLLTARHQTGRVFVLSAATLFVASLIISSSVEFAQIWVRGRFPSMQDVRAQSIGTIVGISLWASFGRQFSLRMGTFFQSRDPQTKVHWLLHLYVIFLVCCAFIPLDIVTSPGEIMYRYRNGHFEIVPFSYSHGTITQSLFDYACAVLFLVPVGFWSSTAWNPRGCPTRPWWKSLLLGSFVVLGIESIQVLIVSRYPSTTDLILGCSGAVLGISAAKVWGTRTTSRSSEGCQMQEGTTA